jgi:hypothetical protein
MSERARPVSRDFGVLPRDVPGFFVNAVIKRAEPPLRWVDVPDGGANHPIDHPLVGDPGRRPNAVSASPLRGFPLRGRGMSRIRQTAVSIHYDKVTLSVVGLGSIGTDRSDEKPPPESEEAGGALRPVHEG